jgi:hypothetical protein
MCVFAYVRAAAARLDGNQRLLAQHHVALLEVAARAERSAVQRRRQRVKRRRATGAAAASGAQACASAPCGEQPLALGTAAAHGQARRATRRLQALKVRALLLLRSARNTHAHM